MDAQELDRLTRRMIEAWNTQDVEQVVACYTDDVEYRDPNTRGAVQGADGLRRYLRKLFAGWQMRWTVRETHPLAGTNGVAVLWHASFRKPGGTEQVEVDGMDFVGLRGDRVSRNEVYFDRAALAPLLAG